MRDDHLTPVLLAASEAELALLIEFLGRPPSGLLWVDRRVRGADATHEERAAAVLAEILRCSDHSVTGRLGGGQRSYLQVVCDVLQYLELEDTPADGVLALELRVVRYVLDSEFERLAPDVQATLLADFYAGKFFVGGIRGYDVVHPFVTQVDPEHRKLAAGKVKRALVQIGGEQLQKRAKSLVRNAALKLLLRGLAGPANWAITAWDWLGPAYRLTVPTICYVAFLRHHQLLRTQHADADQARAAS
jgi:uncharacterized protein YaaW (UPF0174 family)